MHIYIYIYICIYICICIYTYIYIYIDMSFGLPIQDPTACMTGIYKYILTYI